VDVEIRFANVLLFILEPHNHIVRAVMRGELPSSADERVTTTASLASKW
jgi:hypothetical protein